MTKTMSSTLGGTDLPFSGVTPIRVPAKVVNVWLEINTLSGKDNMGWFCALDDGRVYCAEWNMERPNDLPMWLLYIPPSPTDEVVRVGALRALGGPHLAAHGDGLHGWGVLGPSGAPDGVSTEVRGDVEERTVAQDSVP